MHTFTQSGLGNAPFSLCSPEHPLAKLNKAFMCEHCGTMLKNRFFVLSSNKIVSVVGIDCLKKTDDAGLIDGATRLIKQRKADERMALMNAKAEPKKELERACFDGLTLNEVIVQCLDGASKARLALRNKINGLEITGILEQSAFGYDMAAVAKKGGALSESMVRCITEIVAKHISGARKNSQQYNESMPRAVSMVKEFTRIIAKQTKLINAFDERRFEAIKTDVTRS
jgi:hypothetical protein